MNGILLFKNFYFSPNLNDENAPLARICLENIQITLQAKDGGTSGNFSPIEPDILTLFFFVKVKMCFWSLICLGNIPFLDFLLFTILNDENASLVSLCLKKY